MGEDKKRRRKNVSNEKEEGKTDGTKKDGKVGEGEDDNISSTPIIPSHEFTGKVEIFEEKTFRIRAKNKLDAKEILKQTLQSQDRVVSLVGVAGGYLARIEKFISRDF